MWVTGDEQLPRVTRESVLWEKAMLYSGIRERGWVCVEIHVLGNFLDIKLGCSRQQRRTEESSQPHKAVWTGTAGRGGLSKLEGGDRGWKTHA